MALTSPWSRLRYGRLLPAAARSLRSGAAYAAVVAAVELARDRARADAAGRRIVRWLGVAPDDARRIYRRSLESEAREEADSAFYMRHPGRLRHAFRIPIPLPAPAAPMIYASLHLGSPLLGYLYLRDRLASELAVVARDLDAANPMSDPKRRFAARKVAWTEAVAGRPFLLTSGRAAMVRVRAHLRAGKPIYILADVPGDVVARSQACTLFGERVRLAAGIATLARIAGSPVQTLVITRGRDGFGVHAGPPLPPPTGDGLVAAVLDGLAPFIRAHAGEWWMWPYVPAAIDDAPS
jgi:hypothetical protein